MSKAMLRLTATSSPENVSPDFLDSCVVIPNAIIVSFGNNSRAQEQRGCTAIGTINLPRSGNAHQVAFSPDGKHLAIAAGNVVVWDSNDLFPADHCGRKSIICNSPSHDSAAG
jgi:hypothetical protein